MKNFTISLAKDWALRWIRGSIQSYFIGKTPLEFIKGRIKSAIKSYDVNPRETEMGQKVLNKVREIVRRYNEYSRYLHFPYEWGERALRAWLIYEVFHEILKWPIKYIVSGEQFDVLFIDDHIRPRLYLETKRPGRGFADINEFKTRTYYYGTLAYAIITDGIIWGRFEINNGQLINQMSVDIEKSAELWEKFFKPLHAKNFLYEVI